MKKLWKSWVVRVMALMLAASVAFAQDRVPFRQEELDQMLAPIALYPDSLLSQMMMAATYPLEVVQAARWSRANRELKGEAAVKAVEGMDWDPSVKSLVAFPDILVQMDEKLDWTERLGEAFLAQQKDVMATVQDLRRRADERGNLKSNDRMRVVREPDNIVIEPPTREVVYVPYYSPAVAYGPWWWPAYPPVYWAAPVAYYPYGPAFFWGPAIGFSAGFFFGHFDWHHHQATVVQNNITNVYVNRRTVVNRADAVSTRRTEWRHDPAHRRGVPFRTAAARESFAQARTADREQRVAGRSDLSGAGRRTEDNRAADVRQSRMDERHNAAASGRQSLVDSNGGARNAQSGSRAAQPEARGAQAEARDARGDNHQARPDARAAQPDRDAHPGRSDRSPQGGDRRSDRVTPGASRLQASGAQSDPGRQIDARASSRAEQRAAVQAELQRRGQTARASAPNWPAYAERRAQPEIGARQRGGVQQMQPAPQQRHFAAEGFGGGHPQGGGPAPELTRRPRAAARATILPRAAGGPSPSARAPGRP